LAAGVVRRFSEFSIFSRLLAIIVGVVHSTQFLAETTEEKLPLLGNHRVNVADVIVDSKEMSAKSQRRAAMPA